MTKPTLPRGWWAWRRKRQRHLRVVGQLSLCGAAHATLYEARCRAAIARVIGNPAAKRLQLLACRPDGGEYDEVSFVVTERISDAVRVALKGTPGLMFPLDPLPPVDDD